MSACRAIVEGDEDAYPKNEITPPRGAVGYPPGVPQVKVTAPGRAWLVIVSLLVCTHGLRLAEGFTDCNQNQVDDADDIAGGTSTDCNQNGVPDECDINDGTSIDCNANVVPDTCDIAAGRCQATVPPN